MLAEAGKAPPYSQERVLDDVVCIGLAAEDGAGRSKRAGEPGGDQRLERIDVARRRSQDEIAVPNDPGAGPLGHVHTIETFRKRLGWVRRASRLVLHQTAEAGTAGRRARR